MGLTFLDNLLLESHSNEQPALSLLCALPRRSNNREKEERPVRSDGIARQSQHARLTGGVSLPHVPTSAEYSTEPKTMRVGAVSPAGPASIGLH